MIPNKYFIWYHRNKIEKQNAHLRAVFLSLSENAPSSPLQLHDKKQTKKHTKIDLIKFRKYTRLMKNR